MGKLYCFNGGILKSKKHLFTLGRGLNEPFDIPVPFYLFCGKKGNVLFDTGMALEVAIGHDKRKHWGTMVDVYDPIMEESQWVVNQLRNVVHISPEEINAVVLSHLHLDHAGAVGHFPNAVYYVQRSELQYAYGIAFLTMLF